MPGDRIKLSFLEKVGLSSIPKDHDPGNTMLLHSFYERADLSGEYEIFSDETISHPVFGQLSTAGKTLKAFEQQLLTISRKRIGQQIYLRVFFVSRPPVYIRGLVGRPGAYRYEKGMTLSQLLSLASGIYRGDSRRTPANILASEGPRLERSKQKLAQMLVLRRRLLAEIAGKSSFVPGKRPGALVGKKHAREMVKNENRYLQQVSQLRKKRQKNLIEADRVANEQIEGMLEQEKIARLQKETIRKTIRKYKDRYRRSQTSASIRSQELITRLDLRQLDLQIKESKIRSDLLAAQQGKLQIQRDFSAAVLAETVELKRRLERVENDIVNLESDISISKNLLAQIGKKSINNAPTGIPKSALVYKLERRIKGKIQNLEVHEDSFVWPGDVVQIGLR